MSVDLVTIDSILMEHLAIEHHIEALREAVADQAVFLLKSADDWNKTYLKELKERYLKVRNSMQALHDEITIHCTHEEKTLSPGLGELLADGNVIEHRQIIEYLNQALSVLEKTGLLGELKPQELMATTYNVKRTVERACKLVATHEANETGLLGMLKRGLQLDQGQNIPTGDLE